MQNLAQCDEYPGHSQQTLPELCPKPVTLPVSVIVPVKNEARNLPFCLESLRGVGEIYVIDSQSTDKTAGIARDFGATVIQFHYAGGWPKKRQWALDSLQLKYDWVLLLDADEAVTSELAAEISHVIQAAEADAYYIGLEMFFLGKRLRYSGASFYKLCLFRRGMARFECRTREQDTSMCDMEVHEHVIASGNCGTLKNKLLHRNVESLARYIQKHNEYSNWEAKVWTAAGFAEELQPAFWGTQAQRRRWLRKKFFLLPGSPVLFFIFKYFFRLGFLDRVPGLIYCAFQAIQFFHIKAKIYESQVLPDRSIRNQTFDLSIVQDRRHVRN